MKPISLPAQPPDVGRRLLAAAALVWAGLVFFLWLPHPSSWLDADRLALVDQGHMVYFVNRGRAFFQLFGRPWGYEPYFSSGLTLAYVWNSNVFLQLLGLALPWLPDAAVVKIYILLMGAGFPLLVGWAARAWGWPRRSALAAGTISAALYLTEAGWFMTYVGLLTGLGVFFMVIAAFAAAYRALDTGRAGHAATAILLVALTPLIHKTGIFLLALGALAWLLLPPVSNRRKALGLAFLAGTALVAVNLFWILPTIPEMVHKTIWSDTVPRRDLSNSLIFYDWLTWQIRADARPIEPPIALMFLRWALVGGAIGGLATLWRRNLRATLFWILWLAAGFGWVYGGHLLPGALHANPYRYQPFLKHLLALPAGLGWAVGLSWLVHRPATPRYLRATLGVAGGAIALGAFVSLTLTLRSLFPLALESQAAPESRQHLQRLFERTDNSARLLVELADVERGEIPEGYDLFVLDACLRGGRLCANAVYPYLLTDYHPLRLIHGRLNERPMAQWTTSRVDEMRKLLEIYNVGWLVCWSPACQSAANAAPALFGAGEAIGPYRLYRLPDPPGYFLEGGGRLEVQPGRIGVSRAEAPQGMLILRFHYVEGMRRVPSGEILPYEIEGDPNPFIEILHPPKEFWINY